jgi:UDP-3-O-[3-hydroxymyristoyl] glucosamine N-acyltransferase
MKLSSFNFTGEVFRDIDFLRLGDVDTTFDSVLAYADNAKYICRAIQNPRVIAVITKRELVCEVPEHIGIIVSSNPRETFYEFHRQFIIEGRCEYPFKGGIGQNCTIHPTATISSGCRIGDNVTIGEHVVIRAPVWIGSNVIIDSGAKIGVDGILYSRTPKGPRLIPHGGYVRIFDNAMLMSNCIVVRSVCDTEATEIGPFTLVGLGSSIGHDAKVGARVVISNNCVLARKCIVGSDSFIGTGSVVKEYVEIGEQAKVMMGSVVLSNVAKGVSVSGNFATSHEPRMLEFSRASRAAIQTIT